MALQLSTTDSVSVSVDTDDLSIDSVIRQRSSKGNFATSPLTRAQISQLLQAARLAPSSHNTQPWRFVVIQDSLERSLINQDLVEWGAAWAAAAPVLIAVTTDLSQGTVYHGVNYAVLDCGLAVQNILLQATSMGLAAHPVGFKDKERVCGALRLPPEQALLMFVAIGYPGDEETETNSDRQRKPLAAIATMEHWDGAPVLEDQATVSQV